MDINNRQLPTDEIWTAKTAALHFALSLTHGLTGFLNAIQALPVIPKPETTDFDPTGTVANGQLFCLL